MTQGIFFACSGMHYPNLLLTTFWLFLFTWVLLIEFHMDFFLISQCSYITYNATATYNTIWTWLTSYSYMYI